MSDIFKIDQFKVITEVMVEGGDASLTQSQLSVHHSFDCYKIAEDRHSATITFFRRAGEDSHELCSGMTIVLSNKRVVVAREGLRLIEPIDKGVSNVK